MKRTTIKEQRDIEREPKGNDSMRIIIVSDVFCIAVIHLSQEARRLYEAVSKVPHCLTLAYETIDKARFKNSLAKYVTHLLSTNDKPERRTEWYLGRRDTYE